MRATERPHENSRARTRPRSPHVVAETVVEQDPVDGAGDRVGLIADRSACAASPTTSGSDDTFEVMTGVPLAIASSGGRPKPS